MLSEPPYSSRLPTTTMFLGDILQNGPSRVNCPTSCALRFRALHPRAGASKPLSAASAVSLRIADMRMMIDDEPRRRSSSDTLHALRVALVRPDRGACWNQAGNSFDAMLLHAFCNRRGDAVEHPRFQLLPSRDLLNQNQFFHFTSFSCLLLGINGS